MNAQKVLRGEALAGSENYRRAIAQIIGDIQRDHKCRLVDIAEAIDASIGTISNAFNKEADLSGVFLLRLGQAYGAGYLNPYLNITQAQAAPLDGSLASDILPLMMAAAHKISMARDPNGPGGVVEVPQEKMGYLPDLKRVNNHTACLINEIEEQLA
jgi:hypothetical protein